MGVKESRASTEDYDCWSPACDDCGEFGADADGFGAYCDRSLSIAFRSTSSLCPPRPFHRVVRAGVA